MLLPTTLLLGPIVLDGEPIPHLTRTPISWAFTAYYALIMFLALLTIWRAWRRTVLSASRRRMTYLLAGSLFLAFGAYPFLLVGSDLAARAPNLFFFSAALGNVLVFWAMVAMAYATAFFGVPWPDRVVKSRLFRWLLRGPVTVFIVLAMLPWVGSLGNLLGIQDSVVLPILVAFSILLMGHLLTLFAPILERFIFNSEDEDVQFLQTLQERALTDTDLRQFLEAVLAAVCDRLQTRTAFIAALEQGQMQRVVEVGDKKLLGKQLSAELPRVAERADGKAQLFAWNKFWLLPLHSLQSDDLLGLLGVLRTRKAELSSELREALLSLGGRAALALDDRRQQSQALRSLEVLGPSVDIIQKLRAASRYDQREMLTNLAELPKHGDLVKWVKDALTHYWGGPKLTQSPLRGLRIVQTALQEHDGNPPQAMRAILRKAIERNKPQGQPRLTAEWMLYNLLEMKFLQGRKVREVALRLAMSEADLYRKQRVAIETVARSLIEMEKDILERQNGKVETR